MLNSGFLLLQMQRIVVSQFDGRMQMTIECNNSGMQRIKDYFTLLIHAEQHSLSVPVSFIKVDLNCSMALYPLLSFTPAAVAV